MTDGKTKRTKKDRRGKSYQPSPYANTDTSEVTSIHILKTLLNPNKIKTHIEERDKVPNHDGYIDLVDNERRSIGQLDVQVKTLPDDAHKRRTFSCGEGFLGYCKKAMRPIILIGINHNCRSASWVHITRSMVQSLEKAGDLTISFPNENEISNSNDPYYDHWKEIVDQHQQKLEFVDGLHMEVERQNAIKQILKSVTKGIPIDAQVDVLKVQTFLDELNRLIGHQFQIVGKVFYPGARKLGFAYGTFEQDHISFAIYEIGHQSTDSDIKKVSPELIQNLIDEGLTVRIRNGYNPILTTPKRHAREIIKEHVSKLLDIRALDFRSSILAREVIFAVVDRLHEALGLGERDEYTVEELWSALNEYLPRWVINSMQNLGEPQLLGIRNVYGVRQFIDIGSLSMFIPEASRTKVDVAVREQIKNGIPFKLGVPIGYSDYPMRLFSEIIENLRQNGIANVKRLYPKFEYGRNPGSGLIYNWLSPDSHYEKVKIIYGHLPEVYSEVVERNFPHLKKDLNYWGGVDRHILALEAHEDYGQFPDHPALEEISLELTRGKHEPFHELFKKNDSRVPEISYHEFTKPIQIDEFTYSVKSVCQSIERLSFEPTPILTQTLKLIKENFAEYFKTLLLNDE